MWRMKGRNKGRHRRRKTKIKAFFYSTNTCQMLESVTFPLSVSVTAESYKILFSFHHTLRLCFLCFFEIQEIEL